MYLSKVKINWAQAKNPYEQHRTLWHLFPDRPQEQRDFLYRVERFSKGLGAEVIMQSQQKPQQSEVLELLAVRPLNLSLHKGQRLRFRLRANPVKTIKDVSKGEQIKDGKSYIRTVRVPLIHEEQQQDWLIRKLDGVAALQALVIQPELPLNFRKLKEQRNGKIQPIMFEGILVVESPDELLKLMQSGIGPAKAFGCGMMTLAAA
ncbi:MAG: type I-E CRISPR-associated protein Cas6/Cse3/CasE [Gammaproteobacteria bacterium]|nr:type I-E CRISPR-associated protein Cas6/Cse3/CasE [Gammaproteobacteria bacterium]